MRNYLIPLAAAAATFAVATPASAQYYGGYHPAPAYGAPAYGAPYGQAYGYRQAGTARWTHQLRQIRYDTQRFAAQGRLTRHEMRDMRRDIRSVQREIRKSARRGISPWEARRLDQRIARLQYQLARYSDWDRRRYDRRHGQRYSYGYGW